MSDNNNIVTSDLVAGFATDPKVEYDHDVLFRCHGTEMNTKGVVEARNGVVVKPKK